MVNALVEFNNVVKRFGTFTAVKHTSFEIFKGEFLTIMGSSGYPEHVCPVESNLIAME